MTFKRIAYVLTILTAVLLLPGIAFAEGESGGTVSAVPPPAVTQTVDLVGWNFFEPATVAKRVEGSDTIPVGGSAKVYYDITVPHYLRIIGSVNANFSSSVTDTVYVKALEVRLEINQGGVWTTYKDDENQDVVIPVVQTTTMVTGPVMSFPIDYRIDVDSSKTVGKNLRWVSYMTLEQNGITYNSDGQQLFGSGPGQSRWKAT